MAATRDDERRPAVLEPETIRGRGVIDVELGEAGREALGDSAPGTVDNEKDAAPEST